MQQADATRIAALCDQQIEQLLGWPGGVTPESYEIIFNLADLRNMYAGAPDISELTPQTKPLYGDGTPGNISAEIDRECGQKTFGFRLGDVVCLNFVDRRHATRGKVRGFRGGYVLVQWDRQDDLTPVRHDYLTTP